jgi:hypothetical protein
VFNLNALAQDQSLHFEQGAAEAWLEVGAQQIGHSRSFYPPGMKKPAISKSIAGWKVAGGGHEENGKASRLIVLQTYM